VREETMRIGVAGLALLVMSLKAADRVVVYVENDRAVSQEVEWRAESIAKCMFARIGVSIEWRAGKRGRHSEAIQATIVRHAPASARKTMLGCTEISARSSGRIFVIADRLQLEDGREHRGSLILAHVLVHEITHALEGVSRHADTGIMKANWTPGDYRQMAQMLAFAPADIEMIHYRLAHR
jgi:hypothetical protein